MENTTIKNSIQNKLTTYFVVLLSLTCGYFIGYYYNVFSNMRTSESNRLIKEVKKNSINLAVDENNNLIMIDKSTGNYTVYQDSVGQSIFNLYAKNLFTQHTTPNPSIK